MRKFRIRISMIKMFEILILYGSSEFIFGFVFRTLLIGFVWLRFASAILIYSNNVYWIMHRFRLHFMHFKYHRGRCKFSGIYVTFNMWRIMTITTWKKNLNYVINCTHEYTDCTAYINRNPSCWFFTILYVIAKLLDRHFKWMDWNQITICWCVIESLKNQCFCHLYNNWDSSCILLFLQKWRKYTLISVLWMLI